MGNVTAAACDREQAIVLGLGLGVTPSSRVNAHAELLGFAAEHVELFPQYLLAQYALPKLAFDAQAGVPDTCFADVQQQITRIANAVAPEHNAQADRVPLSRGGLGLPHLSVVRDLSSVAVLLGMLLDGRKHVADVAWSMVVRGADNVPNGFWQEALNACPRLSVTLNHVTRAVRVADDPVTAPPPARELVHTLEAAYPFFRLESRPCTGLSKSLIAPLLSLTYGPKPRLSNDQLRAAVRLQLREPVHCPVCGVTEALHHHTCDKTPGYLAFPTYEMHQAVLRALREWAALHGVTINTKRSAGGNVVRAPHIPDGVVTTVFGEDGAPMLVEVKTSSTWQGIRRQIGVAKRQYNGTPAIAILLTAAGDMPKHASSDLAHLQALADPLKGRQVAPLRDYLARAVASVEVKRYARWTAAQIANRASATPPPPAAHAFSATDAPSHAPLSDLSDASVNAPISNATGASAAPLSDRIAASHRAPAQPPHHRPVSPTQHTSDAREMLNAAYGTM